MDDPIIVYYDLQALLALDSLNTRRFADKFALTAKAYFRILTDFLTASENAGVALSRFINRNGDIDAYRCLDNSITMLVKLECDAYIEEMYSVLGAYETGNWRLAAYHAERIKDSFDDFYSKILAAKRTVEEIKSPKIDVTLKTYLETFENNASLYKPGILAVDDSPVILKSVTSALSAEYKVYTLQKPLLLENLLKRITPELFLLDYKMPGINGFDLIPVIRGYEAHKDTPIVFLTSEGTVDIVKSALALGARDFIVKPFVPEELRGKIAKWIV